MNKDTLALIALELDLSDLLNFCSSSRNLRNICNESFWLRKLKHDFPRLWISVKERLNSNNLSNKDLYIYLRSIVNMKNIEGLLNKILHIQEEFKYSLSIRDTIYDLLYKNYDIWKLISYPSNEISRKLNEYYLGGDLTANIRLFVDLGNLFTLTDEIFSDYRQDDKDRIRSFLSEKLEDLDDEGDWRREDPNLYKNKKHFIEVMRNLEENLQNNIISNTNKEVREEIRENQKDVFDQINHINAYIEDFPDLFYNKKEIELLQILHDAVRTGILKIFDPLDSKFIYTQLTH
jgi:hypothetical protein